MASTQQSASKTSAASAKGALKGDLQDKPLEAIIYHVFQSKLDTQLQLECEGKKRTLYFRAGLPIFTSSSLPSENFPAYLSAKGVFSTPELQELKKKEAAEGFSFLSSSSIPRLKEHAQVFTRERVVALFQWQNGSFQLQGLPAFFQKFSLDGADPLPLIYSGIKNYYEMGLLAKKFEKIQERLLVATPDMKNMLGKLDLTSQELAFLTKIDGKANITQLSVSSGMDLLSALRLIWTLFSLRMVGMVQTEETRNTLIAAEAAKKEPVNPSVSTEKKSTEAKEEEQVLDPKVLRKQITEKFKVYEKEDFFQILGVERKDPAAKIRKSYFTLARRFHPDVLASLGMSDLGKQAGSIFAKMTQAQETLSNADLRKEYEASLSVDPNVMSKVDNILKAEMEFQKGEIMLRNRAYPAAQQQFELAMKLNPEEAEHFVYLGWARFLNAKGSKEQAALEAQKMIQRGMGMRANLDVGHLFLGRIAKALNNLKDAETHFQKALQMNPANDQAEMELRVMDKRKK